MGLRLATPLTVALLAVPSRGDQAKVAPQKPGVCDGLDETQCWEARIQAYLKTRRAQTPESIEQQMQNLEEQLRELRRRYPQNVLPISPEHPPQPAQERT
jgi:hypothetical protein